MAELENLPEWAGRRRDVAPDGPNADDIPDEGVADVLQPAEEDSAIGATGPAPKNRRSGRSMLAVAGISVVAGLLAGYVYLLLGG